MTRVARSNRIHFELGATLTEVCIAIPIFFIITIAVVSFSLISAQHAILNDSLRIAGRRTVIQAPPLFADTEELRGCGGLAAVNVRSELGRYRDMPPATTLAVLETQEGVRGLNINVAAKLVCPFCSMLGNSDRYSETMFFPLEDQTACQ